jgi:23S rRNA (cytosine1962-C5)-methyltransferase
VNTVFFRKYIRFALSIRKGLYRENFHTAFRLINSEGDLLPGFTADLYGHHIILKWTSLGYYNYTKEIVNILIDEVKNMLGVDVNFVMNKLTPEEMKEEGISNPPIILFGAPEQEETSIYQDGFIFSFYPLEMQKTGYYLDQRWNRLFLRDFLDNRKGLKILDGYCYTGAFSHYLYEPDFHLDAVDSSNPALKTAENNFKKNGITNVNLVEADTVRFLKQNFGYDLIILDPPKILRKKEHKEDALKKYINLNFTAALSVKPGGFLATFSCSGNLFLHEFENALLEALRQTERSFKVLTKTVNAPDHPFNPAVPETGYLKFIFAQIL